MEKITELKLRFWQFLVVGSLLGLLLGMAHAETIEGKVVAVLDGDTVTVLDSRNSQHRIRLAGIDAPEKAQPFGMKSKYHLSNLIFGQQVNVNAQGTDKYGRTIGIIFVGGVDANLEQVKAGLAWHYKQYQKTQSPGDRIAYSQAEQRAREERLGLWSEANPVPPWDFRHGQ